MTSSNRTLENITNTFKNADNNSTLKVLKQIGDGLQSKVYLAKLHNDRQESSEISDSSHTIALKVIAKDEHKVLGVREYETLKRIEGHPNVIKAFSHSSDLSRSELLQKSLSNDNNEIRLDRSSDFIAMEYC